ncbi:hypothetical protein AB4305_09460 [Nocardia sp. 2YAB30]|uniref:hypothetical protein n=1 Tax=unclassified Nocardia TaxID=2637762 RepID=UPI003F97082A
MPTGGYSVPLFLGQGLAHLEVPVRLTLELIAELRSSGTDLRVGIYTGDHRGAAARRSPTCVRSFDRR